MRVQEILTKEFLQEEYIEKRKSQKQIAEEVGCHLGTIETYMKKHDLVNKIFSRYKVREDLMTENNPYFMYAVGLYMTDGSISNGNRLSIRLNDKDIIDVLCNYFDCPRYFCRRDGVTPQYEFNIPYSTPLTKYCQKLSNDNSKTFDITCPSNILNDDLKLLLIRGIIDGDGSIRKDLSDIRVFTASNNMQNTLSTVLKELNINHTIQTTIYGPYKKTGWTIYIGKENATKDALRIYEKYPELAIQRKRNIVKNKVEDIVRTYEMINHKNW